MKDLVYKEKLESENKLNHIVKNLNKEKSDLIHERDMIANKCSVDNALAAKARAKAEAYQKEQKLLLETEKQRVDDLAESKIKDTKMKLEKDAKEKISLVERNYKEQLYKGREFYKHEYLAKESWHIFVFTFCVLWLVIQALSSTLFKTEFINFASGIKNYIVNAGPFLIDTAKSGAITLSNIQSEIMSNILYWIVFILYALIVFLLLYVAPTALILGCCYYYFRSKYFDKINRWIMIGSGILFIAMSSELFYEPEINLFLLWLIIQLTIPLMRFIIIPLIVITIDKIKGLDEFQKKKFMQYIVITFVSILGIVFILLAIRIFAESLSKILGL